MLADRVRPILADLTRPTVLVAHGGVAASLSGRRLRGLDPARRQHRHLAG